MDLLYKNDFMIDGEVRNLARRLCGDWHDGPRTPMGRLYFGSFQDKPLCPAEVPAAMVAAELAALLSGDSKYVEKDRAELEQFAAYVDKQVAREKYFALLKRAATAAKEAGMRYGDAFNHAVNALSEGDLK